jgi:nucleosome binding factor SPN SPT16 subunit
MSGKGDGYRPVDREKFSSNWDRIFSKTEDCKFNMSPAEVASKMWLLKQLEEKSEAVKHQSEQIEKAPDRCPNTIDIEEQLNAEK